MFLFGFGGYYTGMFFDPTYILVIIALIITSLASLGVRSAYGKYAKVRNSSGFTGEQAAKIFLNSHRLGHIRLTSVNGELQDHFDPKNNVVRLSSSNYSHSSIAAVTVAAHECGHVIQYQENYLPVIIRGSMVPVVNFASGLAWPIFLLGIFFSSFRFLMPIGIILFAASVVFHLITLPVELDASARGMRLLRENNILQNDELVKARKVLNAAAMTYVAAAAGSLLQLLRLILIAKSYDRD